MSVPLARYLKDFGPTVASAPSSLLADVDGDAPAFLPPPIEEQVDIELERREAYAAGYEAAERALTERHQAVVEEMATAHRDELTALVEEHETAAAERLRRGVEALTSALSTSVEAALLQLLRPVIEEKLAEKTAAAFAARVADEFSQEGGAKLQVRGPRLFLDHAMNHLVNLHVAADYEEASKIDLSFQVNDSVLLARLGGYFDAMKGALDE